MKYRLLFIVGFLLYPMISWTFIECYPSFETDSFLLKIYTLLTGFSIFFSLLLLFLAVRTVVRQVILSDEVEVLEQSQKIRTQQDLELRALKQNAKNRLEDFFLEMNELLGLLDSSEIGSAEKYIQELVCSDNSKKTPRYCQDSFIDLILTDRKREAENHGIRVDYQIYFPSMNGKSSLTYPQLSSIFFNLLNNGIESCKNSGVPIPFLLLKVTFKSQILQIHMENSKAPVIKFNGQTTKRDKLLHGAGLKIIEQIAKEHHGFCRWQDNKNIFVSDILLDHTAPPADNPDER